MKIKRTERGWPGHFICATDCIFRRNTLLQYGKTYVVVSTVGDMRRDGKNEEIGINRMYETMAFLSDPNDALYHDIDSAQQISPSPEVKWSIAKIEEGSDNEANKMHENYVTAIEKMLIERQI